LSGTDPDFNAYKSVVTKLAHLMLSLEEQSHFLSRDNSAPNTGKLYSLCETLISDLNNYCECMIPIDDLNTLNLKLFPTYAPPPPVKGWHVPIFTVRLESLMDENWDLTMQRIVPHINGISSVKHIANLADADLGLTKQCIKHLIYYGCVLLLDVFSFNAIYAPTAEFATTIAVDEDMQRECARYVNTAFAPTTTADKLNNAVVQPDAPLTGDDIWPLTSSGKIVDGVGIVELFAALKQGQSVREWYAENSDMLASIDLRRFITFGVIKGFVYRVHKYPYAVNHGAGARSNGAGTTNGTGGINTEKGRKIPDVNPPRDQPAKMRDMAIVGPRSMSSEVPITEEDNEDDDDAATIISKSRRRRNRRRQRRRERRDRSGENSESSDSPSTESEEDKEQRLNEKLGRYLDGSYCFDQICTELEISEAELSERLRRWNSLIPGAGEVLVIHR
jgi:nitrogen permease regulator 2-like protein